MNKISVIIPCYNVEKYIRDCLESILNQTIGKDHLEIILVDDCSTDGTVEILREYEKMYPEQILLVLCEQNGRQGTARNIGMEYVTGEFVSFIDSDDYIVKDMYEELLKMAMQYQADIVQFRYSSNVEELKDRSKLKWQVYDYSQEDNRRSFILRDEIMNNSCTTKLYRRELIQRAGSRFGEGVSYEEPLFTYPLKFYVNKVCVTEQAFYYYRPNEDGTTIKRMNVPESIADHIQVQRSLYIKMRNMPFYNMYAKEIDLYFLHSFFVEPLYFLNRRKLKFPMRLFREMVSFVLEILPDWKSNTYVKDERFFQERHILNLLEYGNKSDEWLEEQISYLFFSRDIEDVLIKLQEFTEGIQDGSICDSRIYGFDYIHLFSLFGCEQKNINGKLYPLVYNSSMKMGEIKIKEKVARKERVKVAFLPISAAEWSAEKLYQMFKKDKRFEAYVVPLPLIDRKAIYRKKTYEDALRYFEEENYEVRKMYDVENDFCFGWNEVGGIPDIVVYMTLWTEALPIPYQLEQLPLGSLAIYIPYGISVEQSEHEVYMTEMTYNGSFANMLWKIYVDSERTRQEFVRYELLSGQNVFFSGYGKMDSFYETHIYSDEKIRTIWKIPQECDVKKIKRVIVAPHHSVGANDILQFSTFAQNKDYLLQLAQKYRDKVSFILKLHPNLRMKTVENGIFKNVEEFDTYLDKWRELDNAKVVEEGEYLEMFETSHGMIMDSISFIAEYVYADRPMLFLQRDSQRFNSLGKELMKIHYKVKGEDFEGIERFIEEVILKEKDLNKEKRKDIFERELDYKKRNGMLASEYMYKNILTTLGL